MVFGPGSKDHKSINSIFPEGLLSNLEYVLWHCLLIHRHFINSPVISTDHVMLISTDHVMLISTAWLNMTTILWTTEGRPRSSRPCVFHRIVMFSQAVETNMTWSVDINMSWPVDINRWVVDENSKLSKTQLGGPRSGPPSGILLSLGSHQLPIC